jgi:(E)-4-hydroxy-3-methylbut-2-enyl-diphosphate synthase
MIPIAKEIEEYLNTINKNIHVAVMGCAVNGPGEAKEADLGIAGGIDEAILFKKGKVVRKIKQENIIDELKKEIDLL